MKSPLNDMKQAFTGAARFSIVGRFFFVGCATTRPGASDENSLSNDFFEDGHETNNTLRTGACTRSTSML
jgi:hypothetical protein